MIKRICFFIALLAFSSKICADYYTTGGIRYFIKNEFVEGKYRDVAYVVNSEYSGNIIIPSSIVWNRRTLPVIGISNISGGPAFANCSNLISVSIPNSVIKIGADSFSGCSNLSSIIIPNSVTTIEHRAFSGCSSLSSISIPNSVTAIGDRIFKELYLERCNHLQTTSSICN